MEEEEEEGEVEEETLIVRTSAEDKMTESKTETITAANGKWVSDQLIIEESDPSNGFSTHNLSYSGLAL